MHSVQLRWDPSLVIFAGTHVVRPCYDASTRTRHARCEASQRAGRTAAAACLGLQLLAAGTAAAAGLIAPYGAPHDSARTLVLDRERVERLLTNEFKDRLHELPNEQLIQLLDELLNSQQATAPELFADVVGRQQQQQQQQQQQSLRLPDGAQVGGALRRGISRVWGFGHDLSDALLKDQGQQQQQQQDISSSNEGSSSTDSATSTPSSSWRLLPWASPMNRGSSSSVADSNAKGQGSQQLTPSDTVDVAAEQKAEQQLLDAQQQQQSSKGWPLGLLKSSEQQQQQQQNGSNNVQYFDRSSSINEIGLNASGTSTGSTLPSTDQATANLNGSSHSSRISSAPATAEDSLDDAAAGAGDNPFTQQQVVPPAATAQGAAESVDDMEAVDEDLTGGLLFGRFGTSTNGTPAAPAGPEGSLSADAGAVTGSDRGVSAAVQKLQSFLHLPSLPAASIGGGSTNEGSSSADAGIAVGTAAAVGNDSIAAGGGVLGAVVAPVQEALSGAADTLSEWRDGVEDGIVAAVEQQGPTVAATVGLTAAAGGAALLVASVLQPLLSGQLASSSKLTELLQQIAQQQVSQQQEKQQPADLEQQVEASSGMPTATAAETEAVDGAIAPELSAALDVADSSSEQGASPAVPAAVTAASGKSAAVRARLLDNVDLDAAVYSTSPSVAASAAVLAPELVWPRGSSNGGGSSSSSTPVPDIAADAAGRALNILWQRADGAVVNAAASAAAAGSGGGGGEAGGVGSILWQRSEPVAAELTSAAGPSVPSDWVADPFTGPVLWQQQQRQQRVDEALGMELSPPLPQQQYYATPDEAELPAAAQVNGGKGSVLWQRSERLPAAAPAAAAAADGALLATLAASGGQASWLSRLLNNAEDAATAAARQVTEAAPAYHQQQWQESYLPWQQQQQQRAWQPQQQALRQDGHAASSDFVRSGAGTVRENVPSNIHSEAGQQQQQLLQQDGADCRIPKDLWPIIMSTSSTVVAYTSLASADVDGDAAVGVGMPDQLPADPWGTTPAGLAAAVQDLLDLGLLSSLTAAVAAGTVRPVMAAVNSSPWEEDGAET